MARQGLLPVCCFAFALAFCLVPDPFTALEKSPAGGSPPSRKSDLSRYDAAAAKRPVAADGDVAKELLCLP